MDCETCKRHERRGNCTIKYTIKQLLKKGPALPLHEFFKTINALLNSRGGEVIIHLNPDDPDGSTRIDLLDQKVDDKLLYLLPGNYLYHQVYERHFVDKHHLLYRVLPLRADRPYSTLDFNSKFPVNKGLVEPSQDQMKAFIQKILNNLTRPDEARQRIVLKGIKEGQQPLVALGGNKPRPFHEGLSIQAKAFTTKHISEESWVASKPYLPAFSKLPQGGSVFLGIDEKGIVTKSFFVKAIGEAAAAQIETAIKSKVTRDLKWVGVWDPSDVVTVERLPVEGTTSQVIQVNISFYKGICFDDPKGPEVYRAVMIARTGKKEIQPVPLRDWLGGFGALSLTEF